MRKDEIKWVIWVSLNGVQPFIQSDPRWYVNKEFAIREINQRNMIYPQHVYKLMRAEIKYEEEN